MPIARQVVDYIPFAELIKGSSAQEIHREFRKKYELAPELIIRRTSYFEHGCRGKWRRLIWNECLRDGITVQEARNNISSGKYNNPSIEGDIVLAAFRGAILLEKP